MRASRWALALVVALAGCDDKAPPIAAPSASMPPPPPPPPARGLGAPGNEPTLSAAAKKTVESCAAAWKTTSGIDAACPDFKAFLAQKIERGARDATFVAFLEDESPIGRTLGARALVAWGEGYRVERALAERVLAAAEKESVEALTGIMGFLVGEIVLAKTGLGERVRALATRESGPADLQIGLISILLQANREDAAAFDLSREIAERAKSPMVRNAALGAFSAAIDLRPAEVCKLWAQNRENTDETLAATAAARLCAGASWVGYSGISWSSTSSFTMTENRCASEVEPTLTLIEGRAKAGKIANENWLFALRGVLRDDLKKTPAAQKKRALALARLIAETQENHAGSRASALRLVIQKDPGAKAFAAKLADDPSNFVRQVAKEAGGVVPQK
jgi:hypothetical protein